MNIIEHRGGWCSHLDNYDRKSLQNTLQGMENSFKRGNGAEIDVRDHNCSLVVSHDMPKGTEPLLKDVLDSYSSLKCTGMLAFNVKCDGLQNEMKKLIEAYKIQNYFFFDMSIPDTLGYQNNGMPFFVRDSEFEREPKRHLQKLYENSKGIWLDQFSEIGSENITANLIQGYLDDKKRICIVSPELHPWGRTNKALYRKNWSNYREIYDSLASKYYDMSDMFLCTDFPEEAEVFFNREK